jgi:spermidine synthase
MTALLCLAFFLSGVAAVAFEALWFYQAGLGLGNSIWASSLVLASFMGGLGIGNGLVGRYGDRLRHPLRLYAVLELVIAVSGFGLVVLLPVITPVLVPVFRPFLDAAWGLNGLRLSISFGLLLIPAVAMGCTMPLLVSTLYRRDPRFGTVLGRLYGWNTLGGMLGALIGDAGLIEWFGIYGAAGIAALVNVSAGALALFLSRRIETANAPDRRPAGGTARTIDYSLRARALLTAAFLSGAALLALEVVWFRFLLLVVAGTSMTFAVMLAVVLAGIGLGGLVTSRWLASSKSTEFSLPAVAAFSGVLCTAAYVAFGFLPRSFEWRSAINWSETLEVALPLMFPVSFASGVLFTLIGDALHREVPGETRAAGFLTLANTIGAMLGSLAAGFVLIPYFGVGASIRLLTASYGLIALVLVIGARRREVAGRARAALNYASGCALLAVIALFPSDLMGTRYMAYPIQRFLPEWSPLEGREGLTETIIYLRSEAFGEPVAHRMLTNSHSMSSTVTRDARYMKLFVYWPVAVHPAPRSALLIGYGVGVTAKALTDTAALETIDIVDTSRDVLEMNRHVYPDPTDYPLNDPRVKTHIEDGRYFLQATDRRFDIITGEPPPPNLAGVVNLYTAEYFALVRDRLNEGGIATYWLPVHNLSQRDSKVISRGFCSAFDDCTLWTGAGLDWMLIGTRNATGPVSVGHFARQWEDPVVGPEIRVLGFESPEQLGALFIGGQEFLLSMSAGVEPLTDRYPKRLSNTLVVQKEKYLPWMNTSASRERFEQDPLVSRLWPPSMRRAALAHFSQQNAYNRILNFTMDPMDHLPEIHRLITTTNLETAPLWYLGSDGNHQNAAARAWAAGHRGPAIHFHLGASALVQRDFATAVTHFESAGRGDRYSDLFRILEVYALGLDQRCEQAEALAEKRGIRSGRSEHDQRSAALLDEVCPRQQVSGR